VSSGWHDLGSAEELEREGHLIARVRGREIGVVATADGPRAVRNRCPHHGGPLCLGSVGERVTGTPGRYELAGRRMLRCPWHGWEFDLETGRCLDDGAIRVAVYPTRVVGGRVLVEA
jgi:nitrite reductase/ring-hydroxylating ferredoxin subunit